MDAHDEMLDLSIEIEATKAAGKRLSADEQVVCDIVWIDVQVAPNGVEGWLYNTSNEGLRRTLEALAKIECPAVAVLLKQALKIARIDPLKMSDKARQVTLDALSETDRNRLQELDDKLYDATGGLMERCRNFVMARKKSFPTASSTSMKPKPTRRSNK
jgi:hypothetical protein